MKCIVQAFDNVIPRKIRQKKIRVFDDPNLDRVEEWEQRGYEITASLELKANKGEPVYQVFEKVHGVEQSRNLLKRLQSLDNFVNAEYVDNINDIIATVPKEHFFPNDMVMLKLGIQVRDIFLKLNDGKFITGTI